MGSQCDIDKKNVIMVNIEELSEEDQRKYTELQEYIKQQFLSGAKKDRSGKVTSKISSCRRSSLTKTRLR
jgi:hypothetical protein